MRRDESEYCPLCGAHRFEWGEGESNDETLLKMEEDIKNLLKRYTAVKEKNK